MKNYSDMCGEKQDNNTVEFESTLNEHLSYSKVCCGLEKPSKVHKKDKNAKLNLF